MFGVRICLIVSFIVVTTSVASSDEYVLPKGVTVLSEQQLLKQVVGNAISNENVTEYFEPPINGEKKGILKGKRTRGRGEYGGTWEVRDVLMCYWYDTEYLERFNGICYSIGIKWQKA